MGSSVATTYGPDFPGSTFIAVLAGSIVHLLLRKWTDPEHARIRYSWTTPGNDNVHQPEKERCTLFLVGTVFITAHAASFYLQDEVVRAFPTKIQRKQTGFIQS